MDRKVVEGLWPIVNNALDIAALQAYAEDRINSVHLKRLEASTNMEEILRTQGAISELRRFSMLRDEVIGVRNNGV